MYSKLKMSISPRSMVPKEREIKVTSLHGPLRPDPVHSLLFSCGWLMVWSFL